MICPNCQTANPENARFCMNCGTGLVGVNKGDQGQAVGFNLDRHIPRELVDKFTSARARGGMAGERRVITILFCDVKGSTAAAEKLDPEEWTEIINGAFERMIGPIYKYEGIVPRLMGDAILAFFGAPIAHEDDPQRAVLAALDIQSSIEPYGKQIQEKYGIDFKVRVGINTGLVVVGEIGSDLRLEYTAIGDAINLAARMEQTAEPGTIQISEETRKLVASFFDFESLGESQIKGKAVPVRTFRVVAVKKMPGQLRGVQGLASPLVGRESELALLDARLRALGKGEGAFVGVIGEAGLGKTSLITEAHHRVREDAKINWLEGHALSYAQSVSYFSWRQVIRQSIEARESNTPAEVREKLCRVCSRCNLPQGDMAFLEAMLAVESEESLKDVSGYQGEALVKRMTTAMRGLVRGLANEAPLAIVLDDLHWMDAASLSLLDSLTDLVQQNAVLFIGMLRPDHEAASLKFLEEVRGRMDGRFHRLLLEPLSSDKTGILLVNLLGVEELPREILGPTMEKAEGNPFFVEEIIRSLIETQQLVRENAHWKIAGKLDKVGLPNTLTGVLGARIDRLPEGTKRILQIASVIGRTFDRRVLNEVANSKSDIEVHVLKIEQAGLIQPSQTNSEEYVFRHALIQDAAYNSILLKQRRGLHQQVGTILEGMYAGRTEEFAPMLAHHFYMAEDPRSLKYDTLAGDVAARLYANAEASIHYGRALEIARRIQVDPQLIAELYSKNGGALEQNGHYEQALANYEEMQSFARQCKDIKMEISALAALATVYSTYNPQHNPGLAEKKNLQAVELARQIGDRDTQVKLHWNQMLAYLYSRHLSQAAEQGELALELGRGLENREQFAFVLNDLSRVYACLGKFDKAYILVREARGLWRELDNQPMLADSFGAEAEARYLGGDFERMVGVLHQGLEINQKIENLWGQSYDRILLSFVHFDRGEPDLAIEAANEGIRLGDEVGLISSSLNVRCDLAWMYACLGAPEKGFMPATQALAIAKEKQPDWLAIPTATLVRLHLAMKEIGSAETLMGGKPLQAVPIPYARYNILVGLANIETARAKQDYQSALSALDRLLEEMMPLVQPGIAEILYCKASILLDVGQTEQACQTLREARAKAETIHARQQLWSILLLLAKAEEGCGHYAEAEASRLEAGEIVGAIAARLEGGLRQSLLEQAKVQR